MIQLSTTVWGTAPDDTPRQADTLGAAVRRSPRPCPPHPGRRPATSVAGGTAMCAAGHTSAAPGALPRAWREPCKGSTSPANNPPITNGRIFARTPLIARTSLIAFTRLRATSQGCGGARRSPCMTQIRLAFGGGCPPRVVRRKAKAQGQKNGQTGGVGN